MTLGKKVRVLGDTSQQPTRPINYPVTTRRGQSITHRRPVNDLGKTSQWPRRDQSVTRGDQSVTRGDQSVTQGWQVSDQGRPVSDQGRPVSDPGETSQWPRRDQSVTRGDQSVTRGDQSVTQGRPVSYPQISQWPRGNQSMTPNDPEKPRRWPSRNQSMTQGRPVQDSLETSRFQLKVTIHTDSMIRYELYLVRPRPEFGYPDCRFGFSSVPPT
jgi:hypothetical protein